MLVITEFVISLYWISFIHIIFAISPKGTELLNLGWTLQTKLYKFLSAICHPSSFVIWTQDLYRPQLSQRDAVGGWKTLNGVCIVCIFRFIDITNNNKSLKFKSSAEFFWGVKICRKGFVLFDKRVFVSVCVCVCMYVCVCVCMCVCVCVCVCSCVWSKQKSC